MSLGKKFIILTDLREGITTCHSRSQGEVSGFGQVSEDRIEGRVQAIAFIQVSMGKARQGRVNSSGLASWSSFNRLHTIWAVSSCLVPGSGMIKAEECCLLASQRRYDSGLVSFHIIDTLSLRIGEPRRGSLSPASKVFIKCQASSYTLNFKIYTI